MDYEAVRYYLGKRSCTKAVIIEASSKEEALEKAQKLFNTTTDKITIRETS